MTNNECLVCSNTHSSWKISKNQYNKEGIIVSGRIDFLVSIEKIYLLYDKADPWQIPKVMHQEDTRNHADLNLRYTFFIMKDLQMSVKFCSKSAGV